MADLTLGIYELQTRPLPALCMCCGAPATTWKQKTFAWYPRWIGVTILAGLVVFAILAAVMTKRTRMQVPFCDRHRNHFLTRTLFGWLGFLGLIALFVLAVTVATDVHGHNRDWVWMLLPIYILAWLVTMIVLGTSTIRATEITDFYIRLGKVSEIYIHAHASLGPVPMPGAMQYGAYGGGYPG